MVNSEKIFLVQGVTSKDYWLWKMFNTKDKDRPSLRFSVTASSQRALPSNDEMNGIAKYAPSVFFSPGIYREVSLSSFDGEVFDITPIIDGKKPRSIIFLDPGVRGVVYHATAIHVCDGGCTELAILDKSVEKICHHHGSFSYAVGE